MLFTILFVDNNEIYLIGIFNGVEYSTNTKLNTKSLKDSIYTLFVSNENEIFLVLSSGDVYKSTNEGEVHFERIILFNDSDNIRKFSSGEGFVCVLTGSLGRFHFCLAEGKLKFNAFFIFIIRICIYVEYELVIFFK